MSGLRFAIDTGGTFTDLVVDDPGAGLTQHKAPTDPHDPVSSMLVVLGKAAKTRGQTTRELMAGGDSLVYATTRAINAIVTGSVARTALLTTAGHEDVLVLREGGREGAFDFATEYPEPYVPRELTFGLPERIGAGGEVVAALDETALDGLVNAIEAKRVEAIGICLLWSLANPVHERRMAEILAERMPGVPVTLSSELNPSLREYRRACSTVIDASLKPLMSGYLRELEQRLRADGFAGRIDIVSSNGGLASIEEMAQAPIKILNSGPAMAPVAGRYYAQRDAAAANAIVADAGGTTFDVSLVRDGRIPRTREAWLGRRFLSAMIGLPSVDVRSMGAGGGSIASVDSGGMLRVGPESAGADPGPVAYGRGGERVTVTDAALVLGWLDPDRFLDGELELDSGVAFEALEEQIAGPLVVDADRAAAAILALATEHMAAAIEDVTLKQGTDPRAAVLVAGGGAAGLNLVAVARRLGCEHVAFPETGAVLSASGAMISPRIGEFAATAITDSDDFDFERVEKTLDALTGRCRDFDADPRAVLEFSVEARYRGQVWELETPLEGGGIATAEDVIALRRAFDGEHQTLFGYSEPEARVEFTTWRARSVRRLHEPARSGSDSAGGDAGSPSARSAFFASSGRADYPVRAAETMAAGSRFQGPGIIQSRFSTVVLDESDSAELLASGGLMVTVAPRNGASA
jgi:N-methylhydantoinase A